MVIDMQCQRRTKLYHMVIVRLCMQHLDEQIMDMIQHFLAVYVCLSEYLLPLPNEVWGKVMFLHMSVIPSTMGGGLCMMSLPVWLPGPMFLLAGVSVSCPMFLLVDILDRDPHGQRPPP